MSMAPQTDEPQSLTLDQEIPEYDHLIDDRLQRTSFHLKTLDLVNGLILLGLVVLGSLFLLVVVDHWIVGLGVWARFLGLFGISVAASYIAIRRVFLPLFKSINPEYAAQTVEQAHPELKNGLLSFLFFRERPDTIRRGVFDGIQQQAASDLVSVPIDSAIDRSSIIRLGYGFIAIATIWVAYTLLSPKNPFQTIQRVALPWREIARPSQVEILEVLPGDIELFRGQTAQIEVKVDSIPPDTVPQIRFSTLNGQLINQTIELRADGANGRYAGTLTMGSQGIQQDLEYHIEAGDAHSSPFRVSVIESPHIVVDRIKFDYPAYTGRADEMVQGEGDIRAIEGTKITVVGQANQTIHRGQIEFFPNASEPQSSPKRAPLRIVSSQESKLAEAQFPLRLNRDRTGSLYRAYQLHFTNENGQTSVEPIENTIEVTPDLRPIVQILTPEERTLEVPQNGWQKIEVRAVDPDFQLTRVQLTARTQSRVLFKENLLATSLASEWHTGQFTATYQFVPSDHGLVEGDVVEYLAFAEDNRHALHQNKLDPNRSITSTQYLRIIAPSPLAEQPDEGKPSPPKTTEQPTPNESAGETDQGKNETPQTSEGADHQQQKQEDNPSESQPQNESGSQDDAQQQSEQQDSSQELGNEAGIQQESEGGGETQQQQNASGKPGESSESDSPESSQNESGGNQPSSNQSEDPSSEQQDNPTGEGQNNANDSSKTGGDPGQSESQNSVQEEPLPATGERDGEVVERIRDHMKQTGKLDEYQEEQESSQENGEQESNDGTAGSQDGADADPAAQPSEGATENPDEQGDSTDQQSADQQSADQQSADQQSADQQSAKNDRAGQNAQGKEQPGENQSSDMSKDQGSPETPSRQDGSPTGQEQKPTEGNEQRDTSDATPSSEPSKSTNPSQDAQDSDRPSNDNSETKSDDDGGLREQPGPQNGSSGSKDGDVSQQPNKTDDSTDSSQELDNSPKENNQAPEKSSSPQNPNGDKTPNGQESSQQDPPQNGEPGQPNTDANPTKSQSPPTNKPSSKPSPDGRPSASPDANGSEPRPIPGDDTATGDDANLEYAREATDLVLEFLKDQKETPDQELLDKLGWKQEDVNRFIRRWDSMKRNAKGSDQVSRKNKSKLDDLLKGMGLQPPETKLRRDTDKSDSQRNNQNSGRKRRVPKELLDPFRAFQRGLQQ